MHPSIDIKRTSHNKHIHMRCVVPAMKNMRGLAVMMMITVSCILQVLAAGGDVQQSKMIRQVPAMYVLGDSTLDAGNNNFLPGPDVFRANKPYYGIDYPGSRPTGRFSNGYNVADYIAMSLGFEESPAPYLSLAPRPISLVRSALTTGVSYASGGAGILDSTNAGRAIPLSQQLRNMESTRDGMAATVGGRAVRDLLGRSFFLLGVGSNDLFVFAAAQQARNASATPSDVAGLYSSLIIGYSDAITRLYAMGARKFGVINLGLLGCVPTVRVLNATGACSDGLNQLCAGFDDALSSLLANLAATLPGFAYSLADSYNLSQVTLANPQAYGYVNIDSACCGSGRLGAEGDCLPNSTLCATRDTFIFWDRFHPSQRAGKLSAAAYYDGPGDFTKPINFRQLALA